MNPVVADETPAPGSRWQQWPSFALICLLIGGMSLAAWQAVHRSPENTVRDLTILAPVDAELNLNSQGSRIPVQQGIHAFSVQPGPAVLQVTTPDGLTMSRTLRVPAGYGPLMIEITTAPTGDLQVGYF